MPGPCQGGGPLLSCLCPKFPANPCSSSLFPFLGPGQHLASYRCAGEGHPSFPIRCSPQHHHSILFWPERATLTTNTQQSPRRLCLTRHILYPPLVSPLRSRLRLTRWVAPTLASSLLRCPQEASVLCRPPALLLSREAPLLAYTVATACRGAPTSLPLPSSVQPQHSL